jgi:hypothetical protein
MGSGGSFSIFWEKPIALTSSFYLVCYLSGTFLECMVKEGILGESFGRGRIVLVTQCGVLKKN